MAPHSSTLAWKIPWTEEPGRLQSMGSLGVGHDFTFTHFSLSYIGEGNGNLLGAGILHIECILHSAYCILSAAPSQHDLSGSGIAQLEVCHCQKPA